MFAQCGRGGHKEETQQKNLTGDITRKKQAEEQQEPAVPGTPGFAEIIAGINRSCSLESRVFATTQEDVA